MKRNMIIGISAAVVILLAGTALLANSLVNNNISLARDNIQTASNNSTAPSAPKPEESKIEQFAILPSPHITNLNATTYNSNPPTSGPHLAVPLNWGVYLKPVVDEAAVHNLEHGGIWISYQPSLNAASLKILTQLAEQYPGTVILSPRPKDTSPIAVASWGRLLTLGSANRKKIDAFIRKNVNNSPEQFASLAKAPDAKSTNLGIGNPFPDFSLVDVDGNKITLGTLSGKPTLLWFTTSWCVPCQIGARNVAKLYAGLGSNAFNVVVVFVDPREKPADLRNWKKQFANKDWSVAFDNKTASLSKMVGLKYLDSKYLLNSYGVLQNIDFRIANDAYLARIRTLVTAN